MTKKKTTTTKPKAKAKAKASTAPDADRPGMTYPNDTEIIGAVSKLAKMEKSQKSASGLMGEEVNRLVEKKHFDKKALKAIRALESMPDERFAITWPHIVRYAKALDFDKRATAQQEMFAAKEVNPDDPKPAPKEKAARETRTPRVVGGTDVPGIAPETPAPKEAATG